MLMAELLVGCLGHAGRHREGTFPDGQGGGTAQWKAQQEKGLFSVNRAWQLKHWAEMPEFQRAAQIWVRAVED